MTNFYYITSSCEPLSHWFFSAMLSTECWLQLGVSVTREGFSAIAHQSSANPYQGEDSCPAFGDEEIHSPCHLSSSPSLMWQEAGSLLPQGLAPKS